MIDKIRAERTDKVRRHGGGISVQVVQGVAGGRVNRADVGLEEREGKQRQVLLVISAETAGGVFFDIVFEVPGHDFRP